MNVVTNLCYYPVKSCAGIEVDSAEFDQYGIRHDREWMIVGANLQPLTQRVHPELALVRVSITDGRLVIAAPGTSDVAVSLDRAGPGLTGPRAGVEEIGVSLWRRAGTGLGQGPEVDRYLSSYLGRPARLLRIARGRSVREDCQVAGASSMTAFADGFPLLLTSEASLAALNAVAVRPIPMDRFRPNVVIEGAAAWDEDGWYELRLGSMTAYAVRACARCPVPNIDQATGVLPEPRRRDVTNVLRANRHGIDHVDDGTGDFFGQNLVHVAPASPVTVCVGDAVEVVSRAANPRMTIVAADQSVAGGE